MLRVAALIAGRGVLSAPACERADVGESETATSSPARCWAIGIASEVQAMSSKSRICGSQRRSRTHHSIQSDGAGLRA